MSDDTRRQLEAAGRHPVPEPRQAFGAQLEQRLLAIGRSQDPGASTAQAITDQAAPGPVAPRGPRERRPAPGILAGLGGLAAVLLVAVTLSGVGQRPTLALELVAPVNVEVALDGGTTLVNPDGLLLPDGAVVRVGAGGSVRIGEVSLGPGDIATVADRRLLVDRRVDATTTVQASPSSPATPAAPTDALSPTRAPADRPVTPTPEPTDPPRTTASPRVVNPAATATPDPGKTQAPTTASPLKLEARATGPSEIGARWTEVAKASRYVLVATTASDGEAATPTYPGSPVIGEFTHPALEPIVFRVGRDVVEARLLVVALSADGAVIARSNIATVAHRS
jgi:hypothetical protein